MTAARNERRTGVFGEVEGRGGGGGGERRERERERERERDRDRDIDRERRGVGERDRDRQRGTGGEVRGGCYSARGSPDREVASVQVEPIGIGVLGSPRPLHIGDARAGGGLAHDDPVW